MYDFNAISQKIDELTPKMVQHLSEWIAIESVSVWSHKNSELFKMMDIAKSEFESLGAKMWLEDNPIKTRVYADGKELPLPPILLGKVEYYMM